MLSSACARAPIQSQARRPLNGYRPSWGPPRVARRARRSRSLSSLAPRPGLGGGLHLLFPFRALWSSVESNLNLKKDNSFDFAQPHRITEGGGDRLAERGSDRDGVARAVISRVWVPSRPDMGGARISPTPEPEEPHQRAPHSDGPFAVGVLGGEFEETLRHARRRGLERRVRVVREPPRRPSPPSVLRQRHGGVLDRRTRSAQLLAH